MTSAGGMVQLQIAHTTPIGTCTFGTSISGFIKKKKKKKRNFLSTSQWKIMRK
jgi:hypothetical protein